MSFQNKNLETLNKTIDLFKKENNETINKTIETLNNKLESINKKIEDNDKELNTKFDLIKKEINEKIKSIENNINNTSNKEFENKINNISNKEIENKKEEKIIYDIKLLNLSKIKSIQPHNKSITSMSTFPSGNIISVSVDKSIIIYDINLNILQTIQNAHNNLISYAEIIDDNNFITCSEDKSIKLWINKDNKFINNKTINNAHKKGISKVIYCSNKNLISCSYDNKINIWKDNNNNYFNIKTLSHSKAIESILYLEDKNILISSGNDGTKFWNLNKNETNFNNINCIHQFKDIKCLSKGGLCRFDNDKIIICGNLIKIISILDKKIIKEIDISFECWGINIIEKKGIVLVGGMSKDIKIYNKDNFELIKTIENAHEKYINGFVELNNGIILSYSNDQKINVYTLSINNI